MNHNVNMSRDRGLLKGSRPQVENYWFRGIHSTMAEKVWRQDDLIAAAGMCVGDGGGTPGYMIAIKQRAQTGTGLLTSSLLL